MTVEKLARPLDAFSDRFLQRAFHLRKARNAGQAPRELLIDSCEWSGDSWGHEILRDYMKILQDTLAHGCSPEVPPETLFVIWLRCVGGVWRRLILPHGEYP